ncbi:unnamed protein product [Spirodela intermedia]|uniref:Uncharacterized protein n=2 Tax=Spirodela intermedia TaxID=51605 RepID=A0ABN7EDV6_SPIIN|nr:unnamed protein product [Spirodela intermedia]CAA6675877.1 unnamed protein product [Spirodela intermedia]CAA6675901.1 unnamed protein product [Spirodela intermedia]CAA7404924.1 unnamed protein product [Spirodela intermedia]
METTVPSDHTEPSTAVTDAPAVPFDPSRMVGIIKRKALIKNLADAYHGECLKYCQELLELQRKWGEGSSILLWYVGNNIGLFLLYPRCICCPSSQLSKLRL